MLVLSSLSVRATVEARERSDERRGLEVAARLRRNKEEAAAKMVTAFCSMRTAESLLPMNGSLDYVAFVMAGTNPPLLSDKEGSLTVNNMSGKPFRPIFFEHRDARK